MKNIVVGEWSKPHTLILLLRCVCVCVCVAVAANITKLVENPSQKKLVFPLVSMVYGVCV